MRLKTVPTLICVIIVGFAGITGVGVAMAAGSDKSADYVQPDGTVDYSKLPDTFTLVDENGDLVLNSRGEPVQLDARKLLSVDPRNNPSLAQNNGHAGTHTTRRDADGNSIESVTDTPYMSRQDLIDQYAVNK